MRDLERGVNPRDVLPHHAERGPKRWALTYEDIARATGYALGYVKGFPPLRRALLAADAKGLASYVMSALRRRAQKLSADEVRAFIGERNLSAWENRFPQFDLWWCDFGGCSEVLFGPGACEKHGGNEPLVTFGDGMYFVMRVAKRTVPLHKIIGQAPLGIHVHHRDHNKWNNRRENLELVHGRTHFAHHAKHGTSPLRPPPTTPATTDRGT